MGEAAQLALCQLTRHFPALRLVKVSLHETSFGLQEKNEVDYPVGE